MLGSKLGNYTDALICFCDFVSYSGRDVNIRGGREGQQCLFLLRFRFFTQPVTSAFCVRVSGTDSFIRYII